MGDKKSYNRYFIIFQEEDKGFGIAMDKQPTGYTKIETKNGKCKLTVYAQNLVREKGPYICCLIDASKNPLMVAELGEISIDESGRGETWWEYKEDDVAGTGTNVDRFNVSAIIIKENNIKSPLAGYVGKERIEWKDRYLVNRNRAVDETPDIQLEDISDEDESKSEEAKKFKEYEGRIKKQIEDLKGKEDIDNTGVFNEDIDETENDPLDFEMKDEYEDIDKEDMGFTYNRDDGHDDEEHHEKHHEDDHHDDHHDEEDDYDKYMHYEEYKEKHEDYYKHDEKHDHNHKDEHDGYAEKFHFILKDYEEEKDLCDEIKNCRWWKIYLNEDINLSDQSLYPYYCTILHLKMTYPYINYVKHFKKQGHYYFGIQYDDAGEVKYIIYGINGENNPNDQPYKGTTGFLKWIRHKQKDTGMWIMCYNPYTGRVMFPKS